MAKNLGLSARMVSTFLPHSEARFNVYMSVLWSYKLSYSIVLMMLKHIEHDSGSLSLLSNHCNRLWLFSNTFWPLSVYPAYDWSYPIRSTTEEVDDFLLRFAFYCTRKLKWSLDESMEHTKNLSLQITTHQLRTSLKQSVALVSEFRCR